MDKSRLTVLILLLLLVGCERSKVEILQERLDAFRSILPQEIRAEFDSKDYERVVAGLDSLLEHDPAFGERYQRLKDQEAINLFSPQEVVDFFKVYFVEEIENLEGKEEKRR